nr:hypothetical protein [Tanacetum cinerariifolium]
MESIHVNFDELPQQALVHNSSDPSLTRQEMALVQNSTDPGLTCQKKASVQISSDPAPNCQTMALEHNSLSPGQPHAENDQVDDDEFINIFSNPVYDQGETSSRHEAMADSAWIESMQEELHQFDRLDVWEL